MANFDKYRNADEAGAAADKTAEAKAEREKLQREQIAAKREEKTRKKIHSKKLDIGDKLVSIVAAVVYLAFFALVLLGAAMLIVYTKFIGIFIFGTLLAVLLLFVPVRLVARRHSFVSKLKKHCKKRGYKLTFKRGFFAALKNEGADCDFVVHTGKQVFYAKYLTSVLYNRRVCFATPEKLVITKNFVKNRFKEAVGLNEPRQSEKPFAFTETYGETELGAKVRKAVIMNPVPKEMTVKNRDGGETASGTGERVFDYTVFSGLAFIENLDREDSANNPNRKKYGEEY